MNKTYDYIILGSGVAGIDLARLLSKEYRVLIIENEKLGGTSLRVGAVPVKRLLDVFKSKSNRQEVIDNLKDTWQKDINRLEEIIVSKMDRAKLDIEFGNPKFLNSNTIKLNSMEYKAKKIILATGTSPVGTYNISIDEKHIVSHKSIVEKLVIDKKIVIYGGNVEGFEIANLLQLLNNQVTIVEREEYVLHGKDRDLIQPIENEFLRLGGEILTKAEVKTTEIKDGKVVTTLSDARVIISDMGVLTFSRKANLPEGIEKTKILLEKGFVKVDKNLQTSDESIYAIGDVNGFHGMAHVAMDQARLLGHKIIDGKMENFDYSLVPGAYFTTPEYVGVGACEMDLESTRYKVGKSYFRDSFRGWAKSYREGFVKTILDENNKILGIHLVGDNVSEVLGFLTYFIKKDAEELIKTLVVHPSLSENIKESIENAIRGEEI